MKFAVCRLECDSGYVFPSDSDPAMEFFYRGSLFNAATRVVFRFSQVTNPKSMKRQEKMPGVSNLNANKISKVFVQTWSYTSGTIQSRLHNQRAAL